MLGFAYGFSAFATRRGLRQSMLATGGTSTVTAEGGRFFRVHRFDASGSLDVFRPGRIECVIVGGGGGGGFRVGGGGGAGGVWKYVAGEGDNNLDDPLHLPVGSYPVIVGAGGSGSSAIGVLGANGSASSAFALTASGGGGGASGGSLANINGASGASGGGGVYTANALRPVGGVGIAPQGQAGGSIPASGSDTPGVSSGGGGFGSAGRNGIAGSTPTTPQGDGGDGLTTLIAGCSLALAGGGGGGGGPVFSEGYAGLSRDGGGNGGISSAAGHGAVNTGGGGGGGGASGATNYAAGNGGSGLVIVRYRISQSEYLAEV